MIKCNPNTLNLRETAMLVAVNLMPSPAQQKKPQSTAIFSYQPDTVHNTGNTHWTGKQEERSFRVQLTGKCFLFYFEYMCHPLTEGCPGSRAIWPISKADCRYNANYS
ncbi:hypothetical protein XENOCAPTIV_029338 [Xenoophorus captivus]|uniref:Uncharacterized protein n=1 Tax=Xenoophorus captivus TaxID=1517983 RepID=A0ABV0RCU7_9TELE